MFAISPTGDTVSYAANYAFGGPGDGNYPAGGFAGVLDDFAAGSAIDLLALQATTVSTTGTMIDLGWQAAAIKLTLGAA